MAEYLAPGVYVEETSFRAPSIEGVGTSTAGFAGPTLTGPIGGVPELLTSFGDFENTYGGYGNLVLATPSTDPKNTNYLALSVKGFFDNGGSRLYVSRVFAPGTGTGVAADGTASDTDVAVTTRYPGAAGNQKVTVTLVTAKTSVASLATLPPGTLLALVSAGQVTLYTNGASSSFQTGGTPLPSAPTGTLYVLTLRVTLNGAAGNQQVHEGLGLDPIHQNYLGAILGQIPPRRIDQLQNQIAFLIGKNLKPADLFGVFFGAWTGPGAAAQKQYTLAGGDDGMPPGSADYDRALQSFEALEDIAIVAAPGSSILGDAASKAINNSLITHASRPRAYRIAVLDTPPNQTASGNEDVRSFIDTSYAALYAPWITVPNPLARSGASIPAEVSVPPSGYIAGVYARNDEENGVAKAPANEVILGALGFERNISFAEQGVLNPVGINCLRYFPNRGYRVWGARTASSDSEFKYLNVRRYLIYLEHSIDNGSQWAVFENNGPALWARVKDSVESFLYNEFSEGNLLGTSPAEAFFVRCDRTTMTQNDLDNGRLVCLVGVALLKPAEFVIFRIGQITADARN